MPGFYDSLLLKGGYWKHTAGIFVWSHLGAKWLNLTFVNWNVFQVLSGYRDYHRTPWQITLLQELGWKKKRDKIIKNSVEKQEFPAIKMTHDCYYRYRHPHGNRCSFRMCAFLSQVTHFTLDHEAAAPQNRFLMLVQIRGSKEGQALNREAEVLNAGKSLLSATREKVQKQPQLNK